MSDDKKYPSTSKGIGELLSITGESTKQVESHGLEEVMPPENLPIQDEAVVVGQETTAVSTAVDGTKLESPKSAEASGHATPTDVQDVLGIPHSHVQSQAEAPKQRPVWLSALIKFSPYLVVFVIGFVVFVFFLPDFSITKILDQNRLKLQDLVQGEAKSELVDLQKQLAGDYETWINQFFVQVSDPQIIDMNVDVSGNGLTNFEKFLFDLNPKVYSTLGNTGDGTLILKGINPWTGVELNAEQKDLVGKYINPEVVNNRIAGAITNKVAEKFSRYVDPKSPYYTATPQTDSYTAPSTGLPQVSIEQQVNFQVPGVIELSTIGISAPLVWTRDVANFDADLKKGVVHYPGTASPGEAGTSYISGHSSGYAWDRSSYKEIFAGLGNLNIGDTFAVTLQKNNGQKVRYYYVAERRGEFAPNDQAQFVSGPESVVALSTCWPVGTTDKRLVIFGKLQSSEILP